MAGLRAAGQQIMLPRGLLARAALFRHTHNFTHARQDLQEVFDIADGSGMRLFLVDYHLEMGWLLLAEEKRKIPSVSPFSKGSALQQNEEVIEGSPPLKKGERGGFKIIYHIEEATRLINETGYHRRDTELAELRTEAAN
uniref:Uncharacterized protein n=1 Tax=uncultured Thiotrichaceae bacterium TaxID=298394 RepID=A0A6S6TSV6_9GAMM|nr:MAG: Unknown protein [uncultured Thiotrichaceae bacterium]